MNFQQSFKDEENYYLLLEYIQGLELFDVLRQIGLLDKHQA